jgi:hypothetical protein
MRTAVFVAPLTTDSSPHYSISNTRAVRKESCFKVPQYILVFEVVYISEIWEQIKTATWGWFAEHSVHPTSTYRKH